MDKKNNQKIFNDYSKYYDLLYKDKDYVGEVEYINGILKENNLTNVNILELGSGTGRHGKIIGDLGHKVTRVEISHKMLDIAERTKNFNCIQGDIINTKLNKRFDVVLALFHVISYISENNKLMSLFKNVNKHLNTVVPNKH